LPITRAKSFERLTAHKGCGLNRILWNLRVILLQGRQVVVALAVAAGTVPAEVVAAAGWWWFRRRLHLDCHIEAGTYQVKLKVGGKDIHHKGGYRKRSWICDRWLQKTRPAICKFRRPDIILILFSASLR
jgi:hypothetical protein